MAKVYGNNAHNGNAQLKREYEEKASAAKTRMKIEFIIATIGFIGFLVITPFLSAMWFVIVNFITVFSSMKYEN